MLIVVFVSTLFTTTYVYGSACSNAADVSGLQYIRMCYGAEIKTTDFILDTFDSQDSGSSKCSCSINVPSRAEMVVLVRGFQHHNPQDSECGSSLVFEYESEHTSMPMLKDYKCIVNQNFSFNLGKSSQLTTHWDLKADTVDLNSHYCIRVSIGAHAVEPVHIKVKCTNYVVPHATKEGDNKSYIYVIVVPIIAAAVFLAIVTIVIIVCKRKTKKPNKKYQTVTDLNPTPTVSEEPEESIEEIMPDEVTTSIFHNEPGLKRNILYESSEKIDNVNTHLISEPTKLDGQNNNQSNPSERIKITTDPNEETTNENGSLFHIYAPSGDPYAVVKKASFSISGNEGGETEDEEIFDEIDSSDMKDESDNIIDSGNQSPIDRKFKVSMKKDGMLYSNVIRC